MKDPNILLQVAFTWQGLFEISKMYRNEARQS